MTVSKWFKKHKPDWSRGASSSLFYFGMILLFLIIFIFFIALYFAQSGAGKTQMFTDILADGAAIVGDTGWGLDEEKADEAADVLIEANSTSEDADFQEMSKTKVTYSSSASSSYGDSFSITSSADVMNDSSSSNNSNFQEMSGADNQFSYSVGKNSGTSGSVEPTIDTVNASATWKSKLFYTEDSIKSKNNASTKITYSGGMRIVLEAWHHTWQYLTDNGKNVKAGAAQTKYVYGGGHDYPDGIEWVTYADCSGFVTGVYRACGYDVPAWMCTWDLESMGDLVYDSGSNGVNQSVAFQNAQPGDIILYWWEGTTGRSAHVAIYAGEYEGSYYQVHSSGDGSYGYGNPGSGEEGRGAVFTKCQNGARVMIRRIVDATGEAMEATQFQINNLSDTETSIYCIMSSMGYTDLEIAGLIGNMNNEGIVEGQVTPYAVETKKGGTVYTLAKCYEYANEIDSGEIGEYEFCTRDYNIGYGICQWTFSRRVALWNWAGGADSPTKPYDIYVQVSYLDHELQTSHNAAYRKLQQATSAAEAAKTVYYEFEVPPSTDTSLSNRISNANRVYNAIKNL